MYYHIIRKLIEGGIMKMDLKGSMKWDEINTEKVSKPESMTFLKLSILNYVVYWNMKN